MESTGPNKPLFSIILAFRNEEQFLEDCLRSFDEQSFSRDKWEIILVDGCSEDGSRKIAEDYVRNHDNSILLDNPAKITTAGWNIGVSAAMGKYFYPASGHSKNHKDYLYEAERFLKDNPEVHALGGRVFNVGFDDITKAIAAAGNTAFSMGAVYYRIGTKPKRVNVVGLGIYSMELYNSIGPYDNGIERSGDWEFNYRAWSNGFKMYINPAMKAELFCRSDYRSLFRQQFKTGFWKPLVWAMHPRSLLPRHAIPSIFVLWLLSFPFSLVVGGNILAIWMIPLFFYFLALIISTRQAVTENIKWYLALPTYPVIHIAYGTGFLAGIFRWWKAFWKR